MASGRSLVCARRQRRFSKKSSAKQERVRRFGHVRPQISTVAFGQRIVAVRGRLYSSDKWKFFSDFLRDYVVEILGVEWCKAGSRKAGRGTPSCHYMAGSGSPLYERPVCAT